MADYPGIARACLLIALDNGGINRDRSEVQQNREMTQWLAKQPGDVLPAIDAWLVALSDDDLDTFCCGGEDEPETEAIRATAPPFTDDLLTRYFEEVC
ncbi:hypothetical protein C3941_19485 [Kaistia algarum]|uniref:hypothetical protein n=1 Tax=Kaistia algarum TaxID=2083279 RepID=UPI000CE75010|nr:hypothetical protein [Kaistia algarum]MCX5516175.1 hypothetical protein [Kaistia algarum]PPE78250.1 hypothetical protein C3941_19485 [Kaistia algarum]